MLPISVKDDKKRLDRTKQSMLKKGMEVLIITESENLNYLSGYSSGSFRTDQMLIVMVDEDQPLWIGDEAVANDVKAAVWFYHENIIPYSTSSDSKMIHLSEFAAEILSQIGQSNRRIGIEMDSYFFSGSSYEFFTRNLPNAKISDASYLIDNIRLHNRDQAT